MKNLIAAMLLIIIAAQAHAGGYAGGAAAAVFVDEDDVDTGVGGLLHAGVTTKHFGIGGRVQSTYNEADFFNDVRSWGAFVEPRVSSDPGKRAYFFASVSLGYMWIEDDFEDDSSLAFGGDIGVMINTGALDGNNFELGPFVRYLRIDEALGRDNVDTVFVGIRMGWNGYK